MLDVCFLFVSLFFLLVYVFEDVNESLIIS